MTLTFPIGQTTASLPVMTTQDDTQEGTEQFTAVLSNPTNGLKIGSAGTATVSINDDDGMVFVQVHAQLVIMFVACGCSRKCTV